jgi:hypothetical protein
LWQISLSEQSVVDVQVLSSAAFTGPASSSIQMETTRIANHFRLVGVIDLPEIMEL